MKTLIGLCLLIPAVMFCGCSTTPQEMAKFPGEIRYSPEDAIAVKLDYATIHRQEDLHGALGDTHRMITGTIWSRVFVGYRDDQPSLTITSSALKEMPEIIGFTSRYSYTVEAVLHFRGHDFPISAHGSRASGLMIASAMRQAVELAVVDASHQAQAIILANSKT